MEFGFKPRNRAARVNIVVGGHEIRGEDEAQARKVIRPDDSNEDTVSTLNYWVTLLETLVRLVPSIQEIRGIAAGENLYPVYIWMARNITALMQANPFQ